jgi:hypothetical protein
MNNDDILAKIRKCLALSKSCNEHEAAAVLRQAQKMMNQHKISEADVRAADAAEYKARAGVATNVPAWESALASLIADAFACRVFFTCSYPKGSWCYVGYGSAASLAGYALEVFARQLRRARANHIAQRLSRCRRANKTRRADLFCEGWVTAVSRVVKAFARTEDEDEAVSAYMAKHHGDLIKFDPLQRNSGRLRDHELDDYYSGYNQGKDAKIHHPIGAEQQAVLRDTV